MADEMLEDVELIAGLSPFKKGKKGAQCFICQTDLEGELARFIILAPLEEGDSERRVLACSNCCEDLSFMTINHIYCAVKILATLYGGTEDAEEEEEEASEPSEEISTEDAEDNSMESPEPEGEGMGTEE